MNRLICLALSLAFIWCHNLKEELPKLPVFIGRSYNILEGNPLVDQMDPGFKYPIFQFTYQEQQTTEDGTYLVPDDVLARQLYSCSFSSNVEIFRGTKSYQNRLNTIAQIEGSYDGKATKAAFSLSNQYQNIAREAFDSNLTISQTSA